MSESKPYAEVAEELHAGIYGPRCPFCGVRKTRGVTDGFPGEFGKRGAAGGTDFGEWWCDNCDESGVFTAEALHYPVESVSRLSDGEK